MEICSATFDASSVGHDVQQISLPELQGGQLAHDTIDPTLPDHDRIDRGDGEVLPMDGGHHLSSLFPLWHRASLPFGAPPPRDRRRDRRSTAGRGCRRYAVEILRQRRSPTAEAGFKKIVRRSEIVATNRHS